MDAKSIIPKLEHLNYVLEEINARCLGIIKRVREEMILEIPPSSFSAPYTKELLKEQLRGLSEHIKYALNLVSEMKV